MLILSDLTCRRGRRQLFAGLSFAVTPGEAVEVAGANGSGKTSLLRIVAGLRSPETGTVQWQGAAPSLAYLAHEPGLKPDLTLRENLIFATRIAGQDASRVDAALQRVGLQSRTGLPVARLSAGQRQRAALARIWLSQARLWLLDEPCAHLDVAGRVQVESLLADHVRAGGMLLFTTHQALSLGDVPVRQIRLGAA